MSHHRLFFLLPFLHQLYLLTSSHQEQTFFLILTRDSWISSRALVSGLIATLRAHHTFSLAIILRHTTLAVNLIFFSFPPFICSSPFLRLTVCRIRSAFRGYSHSRRITRVSWTTASNGERESAAHLLALWRRHSLSLEVIIVIECLSPCPNDTSFRCTEIRD